MRMRLPRTAIQFNAQFKWWAADESPYPGRASLDARVNDIALLNLGQFARRRDIPIRR